MFIFKFKLVDGSIQLAEKDSFELSPVANMHPDLLEVTAYTSEGKRLVKIKRHFQRYYIKHKYKPLPPEEKKQEDGSSEHTPDVTQKVSAD